MNYWAFSGTALRIDHAERLRARGAPEAHGSADRLAELIAASVDGSNLETSEACEASAAERAAKMGVKSVA